MSEGLHVHTPHEEAVHHAAQESHHGLGQWVAIFTALIASMGAVVSYEGNTLMDDVLLSKNEAVLKKAKATDEWNYYQAVSTKTLILDLQLKLSPHGGNTALHQKLEKYKAQKLEIRQHAEALEKESEAANVESAKLRKPRHNLEISMIFFQISISLASITALTRRRWLFAGGILSAALGMGLAISAWMLMVE